MHIAVVIPSYRVAAKILGVLSGIGPEVRTIVVVDDRCPEKSGELVKRECRDPRVHVLMQPENQGVGGATLAGFAHASALGAEILVKLDGDGQMNPALIGMLVKPIVNGKADYAKGNRFYSPRYVRGMPPVRLVGNAGLGFLSKITTGYWGLSDPANGFVALHSALLPLLEPERLAKRYFFENDLLFRLSLVRAAVVDVPMHAFYDDEKSNLSVTHSLLSFPGKFLVRFLKRIGYRYFLRDFSMGSVLLVAGLLLFVFGGAFGLHHWLESARTGHVATSGTVMVAALPVFLGFQMLTFAVLFDVMTTPKEAIYPTISDSSR